MHFEPRKHLWECFWDTAAFADIPSEHLKPHFFSRAVRKEEKKNAAEGKSHKSASIFHLGKFNLEASKLAFSR